MGRDDGFNVPSYTHIAGFGMAMVAVRETHSFQRKVDREELICRPIERASSAVGSRQKAKRWVRTVLSGEPQTMQAMVDEGNQVRHDPGPR
jgi:hypothetical protein